MGHTRHVKYGLRLGETGIHDAQRPPYDYAANTQQGPDHTVRALLVH